MCILCTSVSSCCLAINRYMSISKCLSRWWAKLNHPHSLISLQPLILPSRFIKYFIPHTASYCYERFIFPSKSWNSKFLYELSQTLYVDNQWKKIDYLDQSKHACELPICDLLRVPLPHVPGWFVFSCHGIRSDTDLSLLTRPWQPDFTSRPIYGDLHVLCLVTCGAFHCPNPEELKGWCLYHMCHWQTGEICAITLRCQVCVTVSWLWGPCTVMTGLLFGIPSSAFRGCWVNNSKQLGGLAAGGPL